MRPGDFRVPGSLFFAFSTRRMTNERVERSEVTCVQGAGGLMAKYKLEYIWLDGYEPVPNLRSKTTDEGVRQLPDARGAPALGLRRQLDAPGRRRQLGLHAEAGRGRIPTRRRANGALVMCEVLMPDRTPHPSNTRATIPDDPARGSDSSRSTSSTATARRSASRRRASRRRRASTTRASATRTSATSPARSWTRTSTLPRGRHQPRGHQRRGRQGPVGVPDLRQGLEAGRRRGVDGALPAPARSASSIAST